MCEFVRREENDTCVSFLRLLHRDALQEVVLLLGLVVDRDLGDGLCASDGASLPMGVTLSLKKYFFGLKLRIFTLVRSEKCAYDR